MENQNPNATVQNSSDAEALESLFEKYQERDNKKKRPSKEEILARYFNPRKDDEIFRALPRHEGEELIEEGWFHKTQAGKYIKNNTTLYCLAKNNPKVPAVDKEGNPVLDQQGNPVMVFQYCPLCAKSYSMRKGMDKSIAGKKKDQLTTPAEKAIFAKNVEILKASNKYEAKLYYIIRGIDRGAEKDGVKFWRFKHNFKGQGIHDKLWKPIIQGYYKQTGKVYTDVKDGIDLMISVIDNEFDGKTYRDVSSIIPRQPSPLHSDDLIAKQWLNDKTTWRDVFKPKKAPKINEVQYLELAAEEREVGQKYDMRNTPFYDEQEKKWVFPNHPDLEAAANTRNQNLDADDSNGMLDPDNDGFVNAATTVANNAPDITEMSTEKPKEEFNHGSESIGETSNATNAEAKAYDDLPF